MRILAGRISAGRKVARPSNLTGHWLSLAEKFGGAYALYASIAQSVGCSLSTAKRICRGKGKLSISQYSELEMLLLKHGKTKGDKEHDD